MPKTVVKVQDHYKTLGVSPEASQREIKSAFRKRAKQSHPDRTGSDEGNIRLVLEAYRILSSPELRKNYDRGRLRIVRPGESEGFDYREWLLERLDKPEYIAKLIFYDLLHKLEDEAISLYDRIKDIDDARLERFFERSEAMDALYCIAEELALRKRYGDAFKTMVKLIRMEQTKPGFGYFYEVVLLRFRTLVISELAGSLDAEKELAMLEEAIELDSSAANNAVFLRRYTQLLLKQGRIMEAEAALANAIRLSPRMAGLKKLSQELENCKKFL